MLILAPRHPQRFEAVAASVAAAGFHYVRRSQFGSDTRAEAVLDSSHEVLLLDTLGELLDFYAAADVAFVGGSLVPVGGHNLLEPAALGLPVLSGPRAVQQSGRRPRPGAARRTDDRARCARIWR